MNKQLFIGLSILLLVAGALFIWWGGKNQSMEFSNPSLAHAAVTVHLTKDCGCCVVYVQYLKRLGFEVEEHYVEDIEEIKHNMNIPHEMWSCHTTEFDDYIVEGHIPIEAVERLFELRPQIQGIAMPGMPHGSPGMGGPKMEPFQIYELTEEGAHNLFMSL